MYALAARGALWAAAMALQARHMERGRENTALRKVVCAMERQQEILEFALEAGRVLLANGGEIFRVQETMQRIAASYGAQEFHVYVLTNGLFASLKGDGETFSGEVRSVNVTNIHLKRIVAVNELSRAIERGGVPLDEAFRSLRAIEKMPGWPSWLRVLACGVGAAGFAYLYGGTPLDALAALLAGFALEPLRIFLARRGTNRFIENLLSAAWVAAVSVAAVQLMNQLGAACSIDKVIIGGIIPLVPGIALTNGVRDIAGCDYLSGTIRGIEALLIGAAIALGVGFVLGASAALPGVIAQ